MKKCADLKDEQTMYSKRVIKYYIYSGVNDGGQYTSGQYLMEL